MSTLLRIDKTSTGRVIIWTSIYKTKIFWNHLRKISGTNEKWDEDLHGLYNLFSSTIFLGLCAAQNERSNVQSSTLTLPNCIYNPAFFQLWWKEQALMISSPPAPVRQIRRPTPRDRNKCRCRLIPRLLSTNFQPQFNQSLLLFLRWFCIDKV